MLSGTKPVMARCNPAQNQFGQGEIRHKMGLDGVLSGTNLVLTSCHQIQHHLRKDFFGVQWLPLLGVRYPLLSHRMPGSSNRWSPSLNGETWANFRGKQQQGPEGWWAQTSFYPRRFCKAFSHEAVQWVDDFQLKFILNFSGAPWNSIVLSPDDHQSI